MELNATETATKKRPLVSSSPDNKPPLQRHLLLHCVDGCVPFLNPSQLERHFPPSCGLWLGMAVQDTCVRPVLEKVSDNKKKKKKKKQKTDDDNEEAQPTPPKEEKKVRGYAFQPVSPDPWLLPYTRVTVPCFYNADDSAKSDSKNPRKQKKQTSDKALYVWTPHGRQPLTPEAYATAALEGLQSQYTVALCDDEVKFDKKAERKNKKEKGDEQQDTPKLMPRNEQWHQHLLQVAQETNDSATIIWKSTVIPPEGDQQVQLDADPNDKDGAEVGVALVGQWRPNLKMPPQFESKHKAILSTSSLSELLGILSEGTLDIIGTSLPTQWAKQKLALGIDLSEYKANGNKKSKLMEGNTTKLDINGCMDLSDTAYARDTAPLVEGCSCMTCNNSRFSRAYIHHLVCAKEMLAEILIFAHNLHHLLQLVTLYNEGCDGDKLQSYIQSQLPVFEVSKN